MTPASQLDDTLLRCIGCEAITSVAESGLNCEKCGDLLEVVFPHPGIVSEKLEPAALRAIWKERHSSPLPQDKRGVWRFREMLPSLGKELPITLREGNTPLYELSLCSRITGVRQLYAKHQGMNPTGSFKDTGMTVASSFARKDGFRWVACASTGNTSASRAAYAEGGGREGLVPLPDGKITVGKPPQSLDYGAVTCQVKTDFDGCMRVLNEIVKHKAIYVLNSINPFRLEGQKTVAFELMEHFDWSPPDHIIVPGGNLGNSSALGKAFQEMKDLGLIARFPRISIIQAEGANPLVRTIREKGGKELVPVQAETMATAIRIGSPASWKKALRILDATGGTVEQVSEVEIALAKAEIGADGIGCEPASAVTLAGLKKLVKQGFVKVNESVVLVLTGHVLKDPDFTLKFHRGDLFTGTAYEKDSQILKPRQRAPIVLDASVDAVLNVLEQAEKQN